MYAIPRKLDAICRWDFSRFSQRGMVGWILPKSVIREIYGAMLGELAPHYPSTAQIISASRPRPVCSLLQTRLSNTDHLNLLSCGWMHCQDSRQVPSYRRRGRTAELSLHSWSSEAALVLAPRSNACLFHQSTRNASSAPFHRPKAPVIRECRQRSEPPRQGTRVRRSGAPRSSQPSSLVDPRSDLAASAR